MTLYRWDADGTCRDGFSGKRIPDPLIGIAFGQNGSGEKSEPKLVTVDSLVSRKLKESIIRDCIGL